MHIAVACDHAAITEKNIVVEHLRKLGHTVDDCGCHAGEAVDYPDYAKTACAKVQAGQAGLAVLLCGSGIGMSIAANKMKGIRAALLHEPWSAEMTRRHNHSNVICFGARVTGIELIKSCCEAYLRAETEGGRHADRVAKMMALEGC